jgi:hypothetical protein
MAAVGARRVPQPEFLAFLSCSSLSTGQAALFIFLELHRAWRPEGEEDGAAAGPLAGARARPWLS